ncbi:hypothetical protein N0V84_009915 [Fusarium piperis]|uniref:Heterokaryon incompatibility domain-containing protein n=1 Tax=Fusarium piperis TaxID=1435070 RepID=A0A9W8W5D6_9HYPO|nr:hypothetical protein N0V84_009915 [Fusarium piperis]
MWLINTETLRLESLVNAESVEYAILSHTWEDQEVSFQEFQHLKLARTKKGFEKIKKICRLAKKHGYQYAWVDTCCIDKSSSAELSEAINSMFRWYKGAKHCYAYLSDYDQDAVELNVAYRMSWAAGRRTSRPEDIAYCLFGLFDVNLPMLYGEGTKAFLRLQEEICQRIYDLTLFAWKTNTNEAGRGRGIFACSPDEFAYASAREHARVYGGAGDVRVSNRGVIFDDIQLTIIEGQGLFLPLDLVSETPDRSQTQGGIFLEKGPNGYLRIKADKLFPAHSMQRLLAPEQINVISWGSCIMGNSPYSIHLSTSDAITIRNVSPRRQWDPYKEVFISVPAAMVMLDVNPGNVQAISLLALFSSDFEGHFVHDIVNYKWEQWSDALAIIGKADISHGWLMKLSHHSDNLGQTNQGEGMWIYPTFGIHVRVKKVDQSWRVRLSLASAH